MYIDNNYGRIVISVITVLSLIIDDKPLLDFFKPLENPAKVGL